MLTSRSSCNIRCQAEKYCGYGTTHSRGANCAYNRTVELERQQAEERARNRAKRQREKENRRRECVATRDYCASIQAEVKAGKVPRKAFPAWDRQDELDLKEASKVIDEHLNAALDKALELKERENRAEAKAQANRDQLEELFAKERARRQAAAAQPGPSGRKCAPCECWVIETNQCVPKKNCSSVCSKGE